MTDQITALLTQALTQSLKDALTPIVREAVMEALKSVPETDPASPSNNLEARIDTLESQMEDKADRSDIEDEVQSAVSDCLDNGSWDITFRS